MCHLKLAFFFFLEKMKIRKIILFFLKTFDSSLAMPRGLGERLTRKLSMLVSTQQ